MNIGNNIFKQANKRNWVNWSSKKILRGYSSDKMNT